MKILWAHHSTACNWKGQKDVFDWISWLWAINKENFTNKDVHCGFINCKSILPSFYFLLIFKLGEDQHFRILLEKNICRSNFSKRNLLSLKTCWFKNKEENIAANVFRDYEVSQELDLIYLKTVMLLDFFRKKDDILLRFCCSLGFWKLDWPHSNSPVNRAGNEIFSWVMHTDINSKSLRDLMSKVLKRY